MNHSKQNSLNTKQKHKYANVASSSKVEKSLDKQTTRGPLGKGDRSIRSVLYLCRSKGIVA